MATLYVSGASGMIAQKLANSLGASHQIVGISREPSSDWISWKQFFSEHQLNPDDQFIHLAWSSVPFLAEEHPEQFELIDEPLLRQILEHLKEAQNPRNLGFLFLSTAAVYGNATNTPFTESDQPTPIGKYALGKLRAESQILNWSQETGMSAAILRVSNVYGFPSLPKNPQGLIPRLLHSAKTGSPLTLWGTTNRKDYLHIDDLCSAIRVVLCRRLAGIWNVATGISTANSELVAMTSRITGRTVNVTDPPFRKSAPWDVESTMISTEKLNIETNWKPEIPLADGLVSMWKEWN